MKKVSIIGGGAAGLACALHLARRKTEVTVFERGERLGRKLSATGNGQGNVTNVHMDETHYFSDDSERVQRTLSRFGWQDTVAFLESMGGVFLPDGRGRVYPAGRQASAITDLFRRELERLHVRICLNAQVKVLAYDGKFTLKWGGGQMNADAVVLAAGGAAAPNFGTDGSAYALAQAFGHSVKNAVPSLVQLRCDPASVRGLKGIRVDSGLLLRRGGKTVYRTRGDVLFTDCGVSGDAVFRASAHAKEGDELVLDLLPDADEERVLQAVRRGGLYCVVNNGLGRVIAKRAEGAEWIASLVKSFPLTVTGTLGFAYAQATKGGIPLKETDENFMSLYRNDLYFAGEILNADGECGGYNLQWAFATAFCVAEGVCC